MPPTPGKVVSHDFAPPSLSDLRVAIERAARGDASVWPQICREANVSPNAVTTDIATIDRALTAAKNRGGAVKVAAISIGVRLTTFRTLSSLSTPRSA